MGGFFGEGKIIDVLLGGKLDIADLGGRQGLQEKKRLAAIQKKKDRLDLGRQGAETIRKSQVERATLLQQAENSGVSDASAVQGALGSVQSQVGANLGFANQIFNLNSQAGSRLNKIDSLNANRKLAMTIGTFFLGGIGGAVAGAVATTNDGGGGKATQSDNSTQSGFGFNS